MSIGNFKSDSPRAPIGRCVSRTVQLRTDHRVMGILLGPSARFRAVSDKTKTLGLPLVPFRAELLDMFISLRTSHEVQAAMAN
jgi:hypothetical protein